MGNAVVYSYHSSGQPKLITAAGANFGMEYDNAGNQTILIDPSAGTIQYSQYDGLGRIRQQKDANNKIQTATYNGYGQLTESKIDTAITNYVYNDKGWLTSITDQSTGHSTAYLYDSYGRPTKETLTINGEGDFETNYTYNANGNIDTVTYPEGVIEKFTYDSNIGNLDKVEVNNSVVWQLSSASATQTVSNLAGNTMTTTVTYTDQGLLTGLKTDMGISNILRDYSYNFNSGNGNLMARSFSNKTINSAYAETFAYDSLYRLTTVTGGSNAMTINYGSGADNEKGNIYDKTELGAYTYGENGAGPHAVTSIANNIGLVLQQDITYTDFNMAKTISQGDFLLNIDYGPYQQRVKSVLKHNNEPVKTVIYAGNYERITKNDTITHLYYITGGGIYVKQTKDSVTLKDGMYYAHTDHLGSLAVITDAAGNIVQQCEFDAWGQRTFLVKDPTLVFDRGYTRHEHLEEFELINMNARLYDPVLGRVLVYL